MRRAFRIFGRRVQPGEAGSFLVEVSESYTTHPVRIPATVVAGARPGPVCFLTAAIHGDELNGVGAVRRLIADVKPRREQLRGTLVCMPLVNVLGFHVHSRYLPDRRDLNREFPGTPDGPMASRIAHALWSKVISKCDYGIDLHTAGMGQSNLPHVRADLRIPALRRMAKAFGCELIYNNPGRRGSLRSVATARGIPTILLEAGSALEYSEAMIARGYRGCLAALGSLRMLDEAPLAVDFQVTVRKADWIRAAKGGLVELKVRPGDLVRKGELLYVNSNPFGREVNRRLAPHTGLVVSTSTIPMVRPGSPICHIVRLTDAQLRRASRDRTQWRARHTRPG
jgi:predicted deacylase